MDGDEALLPPLCTTLIELVRTVSNYGEKQNENIHCEENNADLHHSLFRIRSKKREAYDKFMRGEHNHNPVGAVKIGATLKVEPKIEVKGKDE